MFKSSLVKTPVVAPRTMTVTLAAPKTGFHTAPEALREEALANFFEGAALPVKCTPTSGGVNNVVNYVDTAEGKRYLLRIYNNGNKSEKVIYEHAILAELNKQTLSFQVPKTLPSLKDKKSHVLLSNGAECCIFELIPGTLAKTTAPSEVGRALGELCSAMGKIKVDMKSPIAPYYDVFAVHHAMNRDLFYQQIAENKGFDVCRESIDYLVDEIRKLEAKLAEWQNLDLPKQIIHGDVHYDNVMVSEDNVVTGLLDFEFCAYDWRAMELAVGLSKYVSEDDPLPIIEEFVGGYMKTGQLTDKETEMIPYLINLRIFSNVIYFTGRAYAKEDSLESLTSRAGAYAKRVRWVNANMDKIVGAIRAAAKANSVVAV